MENDPAVQQTFLVRLQQALAVARLHEMGNVALADPLADLETGLAAAAVQGPISIRVDYGSEVLFLNEKTVKAKRSLTQTMDALIKQLGQLGVGELRFGRALDKVEVEAFVRIVKERQNPDPLANATALQKELGNNGLKGAVDVLTIEQAATKAVDKRVVVDDATAVRLTYARTLVLLREFQKHISNEELHRYFWRKLQRSVQGIDSLAARVPNHVLSLTLVRDVDEYAYAHAANTCIFTVLLSRKAGLTRTQTAIAGLAALVHGLGRFRTDPATVAAPERTPEQAKDYALHPYRSIGALLEAKRLDDVVLLCGLVAFQYEGPIAPTRAQWEELHPIARLVSIAEAYDALTSPLGGSKLPDQALAAMLAGQVRDLDMTLLGMFANLLGLYPPGSALQLDSGEIAVVVHPNPDDPSRPTVAIVRDASGADVDGDIVDLAKKNPDGAFAKNVVAAVDSKELGLKIPEYLLA